MSNDKNTSPVSWYIGSYQLRFVELADAFNDDPEHRFLCWSDTVIVRADNLDQAYDKVVAIGMARTEPYKGGPQSVDVQWLFEGVTELLPIYEELEDGAEVMWAESTSKLKTIRRQVVNKQDVYQT